MQKLLFILTVVCCSIATAEILPTDRVPAHSVIVYVWDGLRPDAVTAEHTPYLYQLKQKGVYFADNHSSYPTFTMMNAASFATGDRAGKTGFFGNVLWHPGIHGIDSTGMPVDFNQPVFTEDYKILQDLDTDHLLFANTLFNVAHAKNLSTATIGKSGPAFIQDYLSHGLILDEKHIYPLNFAQQLQQDNYPLPALSSLRFQAGELTLAANNGGPTDAEKIYYLADNATPDASDQHGSPFNRANEYMMQVYLNELMAKKIPRLSVIWMRNPDTTEHVYGPGTPNYYAALESNDRMLGLLLATLKDQHLETSTDIIIVSDHGHSTVSGPLNQFPLRKIIDGHVGEMDPQGYSVSGEIRSADLLTQAGLLAYDGGGCANNPILSGIKRTNTPLHTTQIDATGIICGMGPRVPYITPSYKVPSILPPHAIIVAANGGSDYFYLPSHDKKIVVEMVKILASHTQYGAIFVDSARYGILDGTLPLAIIGIENAQGRNPDVVVGLSYDETAKVNGLAGIEFSDNVNTRGMHGSFSPVDIHNFLLAIGPDFKTQMIDQLPTGNVDVAPTIAHVLGLELPDTDGRILWEALAETNQQSYTKQKNIIRSTMPLQYLTIYNALGQIIPATRFETVLYTQILTDQNGEQHYYFDYAKGNRSVATSQNPSTLREHAEFIGAPSE